MTIYKNFKKTLGLNFISLAGYILSFVLFSFLLIVHNILFLLIFLTISFRIGILFAIILLLIAIIEILLKNPFNKFISIELNDSIFYIGILLFSLFIIIGLFIYKM